MKEASQYNAADHRGRSRVEAPPAWQPPSQQVAGMPPTYIFNGPVDPRVFGAVTGAVAASPSELRSSPTTQSEADRIIEEFFA
jgi:hypothetical protein